MTPVASIVFSVFLSFLWIALWQLGWSRYAKWKDKRNPLMRAIDSMVTDKEERLRAIGKAMRGAGMAEIKVSIKDVEPYAKIIVKGSEVHIWTSTYGTSWDKATNAAETHVWQALVKGNKVITQVKVIERCSVLEQLAEIEV